MSVAARDAVKERGSSDSQLLSRKGGATLRPEKHISRGAVSLAWLQQFSQKLGDLTTQQLVDQVIKPATVKEKCRYTSILLKDETTKNIVSQGKAFYFVSHAWSRPFRETLDMVFKHFEPKQQQLWRRRDGQPLPVLRPEEVFLWFDMFAVNQHVHDQTASDLAGLWEAVHDAEETLMVLDLDGTVLTRIWCLYEAWQTRRAGGDKLRLLSYSHQISRLKKVFIDMDVRSAVATKEEDRARILEDIKKDSGGLHAMTHMLKEALVAGVLAQVRPLVEMTWATSAEGDCHAQKETLLQDIYVLEAAAMLCELYGHYQQSEPLYRQALAGYEKVLGATHTDTLTSTNNLAGLLQSQGKYSEAEPLYRRVLEGREQVLGANHPSTLTTVNNLAGLLKSQGKYVDAESQYQRAMEGFKQVLGSNHPSTFTSVNNLAVLLVSQGKLSEAEPLYRGVLLGREQVLGADHPDTLISANNLAGLLESQGKYSAAEPLYKRALKFREQVLGANHPDTLISVNNLAGLMESQKNFSEAERLYRKALDGFKQVLGANHPSTLTSINNLAGLLKAQHKYTEAESLYKTVLKGFTRVLGDNHPDTLTAVHNMAVLLASQGKYSEAEPLYRRVLEGRKQVLGANHPQTLISVNNLAALLRSQGKHSKA